MDLLLKNIHRNLFNILRISIFRIYRYRQFNLEYNPKNYLPFSNFCPLHLTKIRCVSLDEFGSIEIVQILFIIFSSQVLKIYAAWMPTCTLILFYTDNPTLMFPPEFSFASSRISKDFF